MQKGLLDQGCYRRHRGLHEVQGLWSFEDGVPSVLTQVQVVGFRGLHVLRLGLRLRGFRGFLMFMAFGASAVPAEYSVPSNILCSAENAMDR